MKKYLLTAAGVLLVALLLLAFFVRPPTAVQDQAPLTMLGDNAKQSKTVIMYATKGCPYCQKARRFFAAHAITYTEYDIENDEQALQRYLALGGRGVPLIFIDQRRLNGFDENIVRALYNDE